MSSICEICGKGPVRGARIVRHGLSKKKGGIGLHTTAVTKRTFKPNLQTVRAAVSGGSPTAASSSRASAARPARSTVETS